jgi:hypothetical protein
MLLALALSLSLSQAPERGPSAYDTAKLFFLAGDVAKAQEIARRGLKDDGKRCKAMLKLLAEYAFLANHVDEFTPEQAKQFLDLDRKIAPGAVGKLTQKAVERYVDKPLSIAKLRAEAGDATGAKAICADILKIDPKHAATLAFVKALDAPDAGSPDAGQSKRR